MGSVLLTPMCVVRDHFLGLNLWVLLENPCWGFLSFTYCTTSLQVDDADGFCICFYDKKCSVEGVNLDDELIYLPEARTLVGFCLKVMDGAVSLLSYHVGDEKLSANEDTLLVLYDLEGIAWDLVSLSRCPPLILTPMIPFFLIGSLIDGFNKRLEVTSGEICATGLEIVLLDFGKAIVLQGYTSSVWISMLVWAMNGPSYINDEGVFVVGHQLFVDSPIRNGICYMVISLIWDRESFKMLKLDSLMYGAIIFLAAVGQSPLFKILRPTMQRLGLLTDRVCTTGFELRSWSLDLQDLNGLGAIECVLSNGFVSTSVFTLDVLSVNEAGRVIGTSAYDSTKWDLLSFAAQLLLSNDAFVLLVSIIDALMSFVMNYFYVNATRIILFEGVRGMVTSFNRTEFLFRDAEDSRPIPATGCCGHDGISWVSRTDGFMKSVIRVMGDSFSPGSSKCIFLEAAELDEQSIDALKFRHGLQASRMWNVFTDIHFVGCMMHLNSIVSAGQFLEDFQASTKLKCSCEKWIVLNFNVQVGQRILIVMQRLLVFPFTMRLGLYMRSVTVEIISMLVGLGPKKWLSLLLTMGFVRHVPSLKFS